MHVPSRRFGPATGLPLIALPGLNDGLAPIGVVEPNPPPPVFAGDPVVVLSYPTPLPAEPTTRGLARLLGDHLASEVGPCVVSGHSMGAMVALHLAADRPDLVRGLVLSAAVAVADDDVRGTLVRWEESLADARHLDFHRDALAVAYTAPALDRHRALLEASPPAPPPERLVRRHLALSRACRGHDARSRLGDVAAPTLVLAGEHDPLARPGATERLARALPDARFELLPGAHGFPEQHADRYTDALDRFIHAELRAGERA